MAFVANPLRWESSRALAPLKPRLGLGRFLKCGGSFRGFLLFACSPAPAPLKRLAFWSASRFFASLRFFFFSSGIVGGGKNPDNASEGWTAKAKQRNSRDEKESPRGLEEKNEPEPKSLEEKR